MPGRGRRSRAVDRGARDARFSDELIDRETIADSAQQLCGRPQDARHLQLASEKLRRPQVVLFEIAAVLVAPRLTRLRPGALQRLRRIAQLADAARQIGNGLLEEEAVQRRRYGMGVLEIEYADSPVGQRANETHARRGGAVAVEPLGGAGDVGERHAVVGAARRGGDVGERLRALDV